MTYDKMVQKIINYSYPQRVAFVTIWWDDPYESRGLIGILQQLGYKVTTYKDGHDTEIRFTSTKTPPL